MIKRSGINKIIYLKYGELTLKGKNRNLFTKCLFHNIKNSLKSFSSIRIEKKYDSILISNIAEKNYSEIFTILLATPGINYVIVGYVIKKELNELQKFLINNFSFKNQTFKIFTKRIDKSYPINSMEFSQKIGEFLLKKYPKLSVNLFQPEILITIEIKKEHFIVYTDKQKAIGGFPLGIGGRVLLLLSGGIDSPVAAHLLIKKGYIVDFLTFISPPHTTKKAEKKVHSLIKTITLDGKLYHPFLYTCNFSSIQHEIAHISNHRYQITIMRRYFFRIAQDLLKKYHYDALATGESLGQVASQTINSIKVISHVLNKNIVLRPLLTFDKLEIINLAQKIKTYNISILPYPDACSMFVPTNPIINPKLTDVKQLEKALTLLPKIYQQTLINKITRSKF